MGALAAEPFTEESIALVPASRGIYQLYRDGEVIYAGMALANIRRELENHRQGKFGECTRAANAFLYEVTADAEEAMREYLRTHMVGNRGRLPPCNQLRERHAVQQTDQYAIEQAVTPRQCSD